MFCIPIATRSENPIDGMYKILSATTKPTLIMPLAGKNGTMRSETAMRTFLKILKKETKLVRQLMKEV
jgi:hypothetical protein